MLRASKYLGLRYDRPISHARRLLRVRPLDGHASWRGPKYLRQHLLDFQWRCDPLPTRLEEDGGHILRIETGDAHCEWRFEMRAQVQVLEARPPQVLETDRGRWLLPSRLCERHDSIVELARQAEGEGLGLATQINQLAHNSLHYQEDVTHEETSAAQSLSLGAGVCQDFAHLFIALCRARNLPARYVSGYGAAAGRMHAWAEVFVDGAWYAFDPTRGEALDEHAIVVAIGRDFRDVRPLEGTFHASGQAQSRLSTFCYIHDEPEFSHVRARE
jgi:transglutaminase-like putative cysteine protease